MTRRERYQFGDFTLDADERQLTKYNERLALPPKTFEVLLALVRHAGRLVTKRELLQLVWPDSFVEEGILAVHVSTLRKLLDDRNNGPRSIETVARSGYRFRADVTRVIDPAVAKVGFDTQKPSHGVESSLAVLPFVNLSGDADNEYFSDGLTEEVIHALAQIPGVKVIARTSAFAFKNRKDDIRQIASVLGVAHVVEGSVRKSGQRVRVTVQLIRAGDATHVWSERYERDMADVFSMQDDIADAIRTALQVKLLAAASARVQTSDVAAYEAFLKGVHHLNKMTPNSMVRARQHFEEAIARDSRFVAAHCMLATYFIVLAANNHRPAREVMPLARAAAERVLEIDPAVVDAHSVLGQVAALFDFDWGEAERRQALAMLHEPVPPRVRIGYARHLMLTSRPVEGAEHASRTLEEDPLDLVGRLFLAHCLQASGKEAAAAAEIRQVLELDDHFWLAYLLRGLNQLAQGRYDDALVSGEEAYALAPWNLRVIGLRAGTLMRAGETQKAEELLDQLNPATAYGVPTARMLFHLACSEVDEGAAWAEKAIEQRDTVAVIHLLGPDRKIWSTSARWPALAGTMNLSASVR
jgi:TolB-like protein